MTAAGGRSPGRVTAWLDRAQAPVVVGYAILASFTTYFCMYAFRKPFAAAKFEGLDFAGSFLELKSAIVISQIVGYAISKYVGIKVCSELPDRFRAPLLLLLIVAAQGALVIYGMVPGDWKVLAIFLNGLPLGMVWGMVVRYLEGRRTSELMLAGLSASFIIASGMVKDVGRALMSGNAADAWAAIPLIGAPIAHALGEVSEGWMPAVTSLHFLPVFVVAVWLLDQIPGPDRADEEARTRREPMDGRRRGRFLGEHLFGMVLLVVAYLFLTAYRDFRDNYAVEILEGLGYAYQGNETVISRAETLIAVGVIALLALLVTVRDNRRGLIAAFVIMAGGTLLLAVSTLLLQAGHISGFWWMTLVGLGSYLAYVPYGSVLFDRLMAATSTVGTAVFAIYLADAIGYTGTIGVLAYKDFFESDLSRLDFFIQLTWLMAAVGASCLVASCLYFLRQLPAQADGQAVEEPVRGL